MTLKKLRLDNKRSRAEVAATLGVANSTYCNYENGDRRIGLEQVLKLAKMYDCTAEEIIEAQLNSCKRRRN